MKQNTPHLIVIGPNHTKIGDEIVTPCSISILLENGHAFDIDEVITLLEKVDKGKMKKPGRVKRFGKAFKTAFKESIAEMDAV